MTKKILEGAVSTAMGPDLPAAASALDDELRRYEELAAEVERQPLNSEKNLQRAAKALGEAASSQERVGELVSALVAAVSVARDRQQRNAEHLLARAQGIQKRVAQLEALLLRFGNLGAEAKELNVLVQEAAAMRREGATPEQAAEVLGKLVSIDHRMGQTVDNAKALVDAATADDLVDVAQRADSLRQQIMSARNKLRLLQKSLSPAGPPN